MDKYQYVIGESKAFHSVCYIKGCNRVAATPARLNISEKIDLIIYVCKSCLPAIRSSKVIVEEKMEKFCQ